MTISETKYHNAAAAVHHAIASKTSKNSRNSVFPNQVRDAARKLDALHDADPKRAKRLANELLQKAGSEIKKADPKAHSKIESIRGTGVLGSITTFVQKCYSFNPFKNKKK
jgi:hypothetical protein